MGKCKTPAAVECDVTSVNLAYAVLGQALQRILKLADCLLEWQRSTVLVCSYVLLGVIYSS